MLIKDFWLKGFGVTDIYRTNTSVILELIDIKKNNKGKDEML
jgi:hypothetical protein